MDQNNQKDQKGPKMRAAVMLVQNNQKIWSPHNSESAFFLGHPVDGAVDDVHRGEGGGDDDDDDGDDDVVDGVHRGEGGGDQRGGGGETASWARGCRCPWRS